MGHPTPETVADFLNAQEADDTQLQLAVRFLVAEVSNDLAPERMVATMRSSVSNAKVIDHTQREIQNDGPALACIDLAVLDAYWGDPAMREVVKRTVLDAKLKLPVIEVGIVAITAMYGMYLAVTGGKKSTTRTTRLPDGTLRTETTEYHTPDEALGVVGELLRAFSGSPPPSTLPPVDAPDDRDPDGSGCASEGP